MYIVFVAAVQCLKSVYGRTVKESVCVAKYSAPPQFLQHIQVVLRVELVVGKTGGSSRWVGVPSHNYRKTFSVPVSKKLYIILFLKHVSVTQKRSGICSCAGPVLRLMCLSVSGL